MAYRSESALGIFEVAFAGRIIDLRCFAYDFLVYSAKTLGIPLACIRPWQDKANDYGCSDIAEVISRLVFKHQIHLRFNWNSVFESNYDSDKIQSFEGVSELWVTAVETTITRFPVRDFFIEVEILLALTNELIQFLISKNRESYVPELAKLWCDWIITEKRSFEIDGGVDEMYRHGLMRYYKCLGDFNAIYLREYLVPYEKSARNEKLKDDMNQLFEKYEKKWNGKKKNKIGYPTYRPFTWILTGASVATLRMDSASGNRLFECADSKNIPRRQVLRVIRNKAISEAIRRGQMPEGYLRDPSRRRTRSVESHTRLNAIYPRATKEQDLTQEDSQSKKAKRSRRKSCLGRLERFIPKASPCNQKQQNNTDGSGPSEESSHWWRSRRSGENKESIFKGLSPSRLWKKRRSSGERKKLNGEDDASPMKKPVVDLQVSTSLCANQEPSLDNSEPSVLEPRDLGAVPKKPRSRSLSADKQKNREDPVSPMKEHVMDPRTPVGEQKERFRKNISSEIEQASEMARSDTWEILKEPRSRSLSAGKQERQRESSSQQTMEQAFPQMSLSSPEQTSEMTPSVPRPQTRIRAGVISPRASGDQKSTSVSSSNEQPIEQKNSGSSEEEQSKDAKPAVPGTYWETSV